MGDGRRRQYFSVALKDLHDKIEQAKHYQTDIYTGTRVQICRKLMVNYSNLVQYGIHRM